jgi:hypothetical protein
MKRTQQGVPAAEHGKVAGDGVGNRPLMQMPTKGGRNATTNESRRGAGGMAPKPSGGAALPGNDRPSHPVQAGLARVKQVGGAPAAGSFTPVQNNAQANLLGQSTGQAEVLPRGASANIAAKSQMPVRNNPVATGKPRRKGLGSAFYGDA